MLQNHLGVLRAKECHSAIGVINPCDFVNERTSIEVGSAEHVSNSFGVHKVNSIKDERQSCRFCFGVVIVGFKSLG